MIKEYKIDNFRFRVMDGDDMFFAVALSNGGGVSGDEILVTNPTVLDGTKAKISKDDILSLYHHCVNVHNNSTNVEMNFFMCSDELPSHLEAELGDRLQFERGHYVTKLFSYFHLLNTSTRELMVGLLRFERKYGDKNSYYNRCERKINETERLYLINTVKGELSSAEINKNSSSVEFKIFNNCVDFDFEVSSIGMNGKCNNYHVLIKEIIDDDIIFTRNMLSICANQSTRFYDGVGNLLVGFLTESAANAELFRLRDEIIENLSEKVKQCRKIIGESINRITVLKNMTQI